MMQIVTNVYLVGKGRNKVLIDAGTGHSESLNLLNHHVTSESLRIQSVLLTHHHGNHSRGLPLISPFLHKGSQVLKLPSTNEKKAQGLEFLKENQLIRVENESGSSSLRVIPTPGHSADHACFYLVEEDSVFTGDALSSTGTSSDPQNSLSPGHVIFSDLNQYLQSVQRLSQLFPKLIFPGHGDLIFQTVDYLHQVKQSQTLIGSLLFQIISMASPKISTSEVIKLFLEQTNTSDSRERFGLEGTLRLHLQDLEKRGHIRKVKGTMHDPYKTSENINPDLMKGPGGLTMSQIFGKVQEAKRRDWTALDSKDQKRILDTRRESLHPCHMGIQGLPTANTYWEKA
jgi:glyoxylase-like metal-dependent hydrolase (beta-lactamase superfamily II)